MSDETEADDERPGIGHNLPPLETPDEINERLGITHLRLVGRADELKRMEVRLPDPKDLNDDWEKKLSDAIKATQTFLKSSEARRLDEKEPFQAAIRAVDGFFASVADPIEKLKDRMSTLLTNYQRAKERVKRERLQEEARQREAERQKAEQARRKAEADARAAAKKRSDDLAAQRAAQDRARLAEQRAAIATEEANIARREAMVKPAELSRSRSDLGVVSSLRRTWDYETENADRVPRKYCSPDRALIMAAIKAATDEHGICRLKIPGLRIYESKNSVTR